MPKHRKHKSEKKKKTQKPMEQPRRIPRQGAERGDDPMEIDDEVSKAVAAYLSDIDESDQAAVAAEVRRLLDALGSDFEIVAAGNKDDEGDVDFDMEKISRGLRPKEPIDQVLNRLVTEPQINYLDVLYAFSDLSSQDAEVVRQQWELIDPARRAELIGELVEFAQDDLDLHLGRFLRVVMNDSNPQVRQAAITGLWDEVGTDLLGPFIQFMQNDPDVNVRATAASGLAPYILAGELDELDAALAMRAEEALLAVLNNPDEPLEVRRRALESIAYSGEAGVRQLIEDGYYSVEGPMRVSAIFAMGRSADVRWRGLVRAELKNPSAEMRVEAAIACGELGSKSAVEDLAGLLQDRDERVRLAAIIALGQIGGPVARDVLEATLLSSNPIEVETAEAALEEIQFFDEMEGITLFDESLDEDEEWESDDDDEEWYDELGDDMDDDDLGEYEDDEDDSADETPGRK
jgi:hypothetical protein